MKRQEEEYKQDGEKLEELKTLLGKKNVYLNYKKIYIQSKWPKKISLLNLRESILT